jgi:hypothetical protein
MIPKRKLREAVPPVDDPEQGAADLLDEPPVEEPMEQSGMEPAPEPGLEEPALEEPGMEATPGGKEPEEHATAITGKYNSSPVGDIEMSKVKGTYNTYKLQLSMGQIEVIMNALEANHADPVSDELLATFHYYVKQLPGPGEDEEKFEAQKKAMEGGGEAAGGGETEETPIPMPPGGTAGTPPAGAEEEASFMPEEEPQEPSAMGEPTGEPGLPEPEAAPAAGPVAPPKDNAGETDRRLPKPPRE